MKKIYTLHYGLDALDTLMNLRNSLFITYKNEVSFIQKKYNDINENLIEQGDFFIIVISDHNFERDSVFLHHFRKIYEVFKRKTKVNTLSKDCLYIVIDKEVENNFILYSEEIKKILTESSYLVFEERLVDKILNEALNRFFNVIGF
jgi:hypothetical protein